MASLQRAIATLLPSAARLQDSSVPVRRTDQKFLLSAAQRWPAVQLHDNCA